MRAAVVHSVPGRVRFRAAPGTFRQRDASGVGNTLAALPGVKTVAVNPRTGSILVSYNPDTASCGSILRILEETELSEHALQPAARQKADIAWSYIGYQLFRLLIPSALKPLFTIMGVLPFLIAGMRSLVRFKLDVPVLDAAALSASLAQGNINSASTLTMLLKTGEYLETWAKQRSRENLAAVLSLNVGSVWVLGEDGLEKELPYDTLKRGDTIVLRAGALVPVDGKILEGRALVNEASLTGEPLAVEKVRYASLHAGSVIEEGELIVEVLQKGEHTRYEQIVHLIEESERAKSGTEIRANRIADKAVPFSFAAAALTFLLTRNFSKAASVLSVDYSCAIKLATPLTFLAAIRESLANGIFFKGGAAIEEFAAVDTLVFDKTGTLTLAAPALERIIAYNGFSETTALKIAACLEEHFPHPVAKAVVEEALARNVRHREEHSSVKYIAAHGIASEFQGKHTIIGSRHFICEDEGVDLSLAEPAEKIIAQNGYSALYLAQEGKLAALLVIKDPLRNEAAEVIAMLRALGVKRLYLLSGDNKRTSDRIARELSLDGGLGDLLPGDKRSIIRKLREKGCRVAFVGDGMNDSPAMSEADVGIAMKDGADLARETADVVLKESSLYPLVIGRIIAQRVMKRVGFNIRSAILLNSIFILMGLTEKSIVSSGSNRYVLLHNLVTIGLSINAIRPLLIEDKK